MAEGERPRTAGEILAKAAEYLASKEVPGARLDAERFLAEVLGIERLELYLEPERVLGEAELARLRELVRRRASREPAQYILGKSWFYGLELMADGRAMVPRRETELLVDRAIETASTLERSRVLDLGTGCGAVALAVAGRLKGRAEVWAADISPEAVELARENVARTGLDDLVRLAQSDLFAGLPEGSGPFDVIAANLPYIPTGEVPGLMPEVRDHEPRVALDGGPEGLDVINRAVREAASGGRLVPGGWMLIEVGEGQAEKVSKQLQESGLVPGPVLKDPGGVARVVQGRLRG